MQRTDFLADTRVGDAPEPRPVSWIAIAAGAVLVLLLLAGLGAGLAYLFREQLAALGMFLGSLLSQQFSFSLIMAGLVLFLIINGCALLILAERKIAGWIQDRFGPNRVGPLGLLQPLADGIKFILKEDVIPRAVDKPLFILAPCFSFVVALVGFLVIPWAGYVQWPWSSTIVSTQPVNIDVGLLYLLAIGSFSVYGVVLAGYASNNKYAFYGGMRATAQMISYEVPLGLGLMCILLVAGSLRLDVIVNQQALTGVWNIFLHPIAFLLVLVSGFAETNRAPFDLAEAEQELIGGYHTEYSSMKFALFFLAEYAHMITNSALVVAVFLGGWAPLPFSSWYSTTNGAIDGPIAETWWNVGWLAALIKFTIFGTKVGLMLGFYMLIRWTIPRFRFDQLMRLAWKSMVPLGVGIVFLTGVLAALGWERSVIASLAANAVLLLVAGVVVANARSPVTGRQENLPPPELITGRPLEVK